MSEIRDRYTAGDLSDRQIATLKRLRFPFTMIDAYFWDQYEVLKAYVRKHGHPDVSAKEDDALYRWKHRQLRRIRNGHLPREQKEALEELGLTFGYKKVPWEQRLKEFQQYQNGRRKMTSALRNWMRSTRTKYREGKLSKEQIKALKSADFPFEGKPDHFEEMFKRLKAFKKRHGHLEISRDCEEDPKLGVWVRHLRTAYRKGELNPDHQKRLDELGMIWDLRQARWEESFEALQRFVKEHGHADVPRTDPTLGSFVASQRSMFHNGNLDPERQRRLQALGFRFDKKAARPQAAFEEGDGWDEAVDVVRRYHSAHGHVRVPVEPAMGTLDIRHYILELRRARADRDLPPGVVRRLNAMDFPWKPSENHF